MPLFNGKDALLSRLALIETAQKSLDIQYYIWHDDISGILLLDALDRAAKRGVKVRLLLDDNGISGLDDYLMVLNSQDNFFIRLFNPSTVRNPKYLGYAFDFFRMNRRMHNKSLIADGVATIVGGRNIGDEYFELKDIFFKDLDVLAIGSVVPQTSDAFDLYWNSDSVFEIEKIISKNGDRLQFESRVDSIRNSKYVKSLFSELRNDMERYINDTVKFEWTNVQLVADDPIKGQGKANSEQLMIVQLGKIMGDVKERIDLISAYFIPGEIGTQYFANLSKEGKSVNILTNALNTTDVLPVHSGYAKYRRKLLQDGVNLYELKLRGDFKDQFNLLGISGASLHSKAFAIDEEQVFIGSFNFDPRSAMLNCEMRFLIDSPTIARYISYAFDNKLNEITYRPQLSKDKRMIWLVTDANGDEKIWQQEPDTSIFEQVLLSILSILPIEWAL